MMTITKFQSQLCRIEQQYRFVYFNEMNLAVKSPMLSRRSPHLNISMDAMRLLTEVHMTCDVQYISIVLGHEP